MIHHVFANKSNIGDWLSALGIQRLLAPLPIVEHFCDANFVDETRSALARLGPDDLVIIGGGGLFMDYFSPFWSGLHVLRKRVRYCIWGVGYCDLKVEHSHPPLEMIRELVDASVLCVVRDDLTRSHLGNTRLAEPVLCPSIVEIDAAPPGTGILHVDNYTTVGAAAFEVMDYVCREYARAGALPYRRTNNRIEPGSARELERTLSLYRQSGVVVSSALHGCIIAAAMGKPVVAVSGDWKIDAFMNAVGLGDWVLDAADAAQLPRLLARLPGQTPVVDALHRAGADNRAVAASVRATADAENDRAITALTASGAS